MPFELWVSFKGSKGESERLRKAIEALLQQSPDITDTKIVMRPQVGWAIPSPTDEAYEYPMGTYADIIDDAPDDAP